jgi:hypothetical protein
VRFSKKLIPGESTVLKIKVVCNTDHFEWILFLTYKMTYTPLRLLTFHFHSFVSYHDLFYNTIEILLQNYVVINVTKLVLNKRVLLQMLLILP